MRMFRSLLGVLSVLGLCGCQGLTSVDAPDVIEPGDYGTAAGAHALAAGAITRFHSTFGDGSGLVLFSGLMADELRVTQTSDISYASWDRRDPLDPLPVPEPYTALHDTRQQLLTALRSFEQVAPDSTVRIGQLFALLGHTSVFFGENFCAGVPLSHRDADLQPVYGQPLTTAQLFDSALVAFDSALAYGAESARIVDLARVGKGRALLNLGRFSEAAEAVASVPTSYAYAITFVVGTLQNGLFTEDATSYFPQNNVTVPDREGINGINWRLAVEDIAPDPRALVINRSPGIIGDDGRTEVWQFAQYQASDAPIRLADGIEARLIESEAALQAGDVIGWLAIHNALRATIPGLDPLTDPGTEATRVDLHFRERAFWLFLTGHRLADLRRMVRQYGRSPESVFPIGPWRDGFSYESATNIAPPAEQTTNPNYTGCINRDA